MGKLINIKQNTDEWYELRFDYLGASDANIIMGVSKFMTPEELLEQKVKRIKNTDPNYIQELGHKIEDKQINYYNLELDLDLEPSLMVHEILPLLASFDGYDEKKNIIWEHKLVGKADFEKVKNGEMLEQYYPQVQQQLFISEAKHCVFAVTQHKANENTCYIIVNHDEPYQQKMLKILGEFHAKMKSKDALKPSENDLKIKDLLKQLEKCQKFVALEKKLKEEIFKLIPADKYIVDGVKITRSKSEDKKIPDYEKYCVDNNVDMSNYQKVQKGRETKRITFPKQKNNGDK